MLTSHIDSNTRHMTHTISFVTKLKYWNNDQRVIMRGHRKHLVLGSSEGNVVP